MSNKILTFEPVENGWTHFVVLIDTPRGEAQLEFWYRLDASGHEMVNPASHSEAAHIFLRSLNEEQRAAILAQRIMLRAINPGE